MIDLFTWKPFDVGDKGYAQELAKTVVQHTQSSNNESLQEALKKLSDWDQIGTICADTSRNILSSVRV